MKRLFTICCFLHFALFGTAYSQKPDSLSIIREFITVCNSVRQQPLELHLQLKTSSSFATSQEDTSSGEVFFVIRPDAAYIRFGDLEQIVSDSIAVLVSNDIKRIMIWPDATAIRAKMKELSGVSFLDSSISGLAKRYQSAVINESVDERTLSLSSRSRLYDTDFPKEEILLKFNKVSGNPVTIVYLKRKVVILDEEAYNDPELIEKHNNMLFRNDKVGYFLVKENATEFTYKSVSHTLKNMPVTISDRIVKQYDATYSPAKGFESYTINLINY